MKWLTLIISLLFGLLPAVSAGSVAWNPDPNHTTIQFTVKHLMITNVKGTLSEFKGAVMADEETGKITSAEGTVQVKSIDTGIKQRDDHLRGADFFDAEKYPTMMFKSTGFTWNGNDLTMLGDLTIRDVTKSIAIKGTFNGMQKADLGKGETKFAGYTFTTEINRKDFGLNFDKVVNGTLVVDNVVKIEINLEMDLPVKPADKPVQ